MDSKPPAPSPIEAEQNPPATLDIVDAKLSRLVSKTAMLERDGDTLWDRVEGLRDDNKQLNGKMDTALALLHATRPVTNFRASAMIIGGSVMGGALVALVFGLVLTHWGPQLVAMISSP